LIKQSEELVLAPGRMRKHYRLIYVF